MDIFFTPSPDVVVIINSLLDKFENRAKRNHVLREVNETEYAPSLTQPCPEPGRRDASRSIKIILDDLDLPSYFSQIDPQSRLIANQQLQTLEQHGLLHLNWLPGETNHLIQSVTLTQHETRNNKLFQLLSRRPIADNRARLEDFLLAEKFRYQKSDWRARALDYILNPLRAGKSPSPFSLTDSDFNYDLLAVLQALSTLPAETPYRVFSVRIFNDTKRFDDLKSPLIRLARRVNHEWKSLSNEDLLRELNLVANPGYIHLAGNWELTDTNGQIISLDSFTPSVGFAPTATPEGLFVGGDAMVSGTGSALRLRSDPGLQSTTLKTVSDGTRLKILEGPREADNLRWWRMQDQSDGAEGWAAETYLRPATTP